jgi:hypothetical protein
VVSELVVEAAEADSGATVLALLKFVAVLAVSLVLVFPPPLLALFISASVLT